jgi:hypothetical protein
MVQESKNDLLQEGENTFLGKGGISYSDQTMVLHLGPYEGMRYRKIKHRRPASYFQYCNRRSGTVPPSVLKE